MRAILAVVAAALCFSTTGTSRALAGVDASPLAVGGARVLLGGSILAVVGMIATLRSGRASWPGRPDAARSWLPIAIGALGVVAYQPFFFAGTELNGVAIGTVVTLGAAPVVTGVADSVRGRRPPGRRWLLATALALLGVVLVSGLVNAGRASEIDLLGLLASVGAGSSYAFYILASKQLLNQGWAPAPAMGAVFGTAATISLPLLFIAGGSWLASPAGLTLAVWLGVITVAVAYSLFAWGLSQLRATTAATLSLAEPLSATILGLVVLGERLGPPAVAGIVLIGVGLAVLALPDRA